MTEAEIRDAYRDLSAPASPPDDLLVRVDRDIRRRRHVRRSAVGVAALAVVGGVGIGVVGDADQVPFLGGPDDSSTLTFTGPDGQPHTFEADAIDIVCAKGGLFLLRNEDVELVKRHQAQGALETSPVLYVAIRPDEVSPGQVFHLPYGRQVEDDDRAMWLFFTSGDGNEKENALSSIEPGSSGTVTVHEATCGPKPSLWISVDAVLGSENEQDAVAIKGEYRS